ncbi:MAG: hypothetical protein CO001_01745 [Candidatus Portnoybacteria bacterium CG_4_8_14_3_um_filter_40_10]|uniref:Uncharacterized protein n=2 Tax=Candidatus Portnoyibacteriota TaxID=1817913 RepID=A0A2M7IIR2_9BACT|nr:MAG: hypothetical protein COV84_01655 [Candidatus Portnoybacteria bacterium CG11_big_fil_rev_8_21_14_0_20_40_15]PIW76359.1 MAG: hypothetical protein CO001_01745 [Candidatus Portnoybacteria bacterium CG_4_8_14_3_um_filter_40_10]
MEIECPFWAVCGGAPVHQYWAQQTFLPGDPRRNYILVVCVKDNEIRYLICGHYQLRIKLLGAEKNETE